MTAKTKPTIEELVSEVVMFSGRFPDVSNLDLFDFVNDLYGLRLTEETAWGRVVLAAYDHGTEVGMKEAKVWGLV